MVPIWKFGLQIFPFDLETLNFEEQLNDAVLDFYLKFLYHRVLMCDEHREAIEICASSLYQIFMQDDKKGLEPFVKSLEKDFIIMPVNLKQHWFLLVLCYPKNICHDIYDPKKLSRILILDSSIGFLQTDRTKFLRSFRSFVLEKMGTTDLSRLPVDFVQPIKQQTNDYDCGLYVLEFAEKFLLDNFQPLNCLGIFFNPKDETIDYTKKRQDIKKLMSS